MRTMLALLTAAALATACHGGRDDCSSCGSDTIAFRGDDSCRCCRPPGAACTSATDCCGGCVAGVCGCLPGPDADAGTMSSCGNPAACCSGTCSEGDRGFCN